MTRDIDDPLERRRNRMRDKLNQPKEPSGPPKRRTTSKKDESLFGKRAMALAMLAPMLLPVLPAVMQVFGGGLKQFRRTKRFRNIFLLLWVALFVCMFVKQLRSSVKYVALLLGLILIYPTWQVYQCSPRHMKNSEFGTLFSVKLNGQKLMEDAYYNDQCVTNHMRGPVSLSLMNPSVTIEAFPGDMISLEDIDFIEDDNDDGDPESPPTYRNKRYLLTSKRSVNKVIHKLSMLVECPYSFKAIDDALSADSSSWRTSKISITGRMLNLQGEQFQLKKHLEKNHYIVRPLVFEVTKAMFEEGEPFDETEEDSNDESNDSQNL